MRARGHRCGISWPSGLGPRAPGPRGLGLGHQPPGVLGGHRGDILPWGASAPPQRDPRGGARTTTWPLPEGERCPNPRGRSPPRADLPEGETSSFVAFAPCAGFGPGRAPSWAKAARKGHNTRGRRPLRGVAMFQNNNTIVRCAISISCWHQFVICSCSTRPEVECAPAWDPADPEGEARGTPFAPRVGLGHHPGGIPFRSISPEGEWPMLAPSGRLFFGGLLPWPHCLRPDAPCRWPPRRGRKGPHGAGSLALARSAFGGAFLLST